MKETNNVPEAVKALVKCPSCGALASKNDYAHCKWGDFCYFSGSSLVVGKVRGLKPKEMLKEGIWEVKISNG